MIKDLFSELLYWLTLKIYGLFRPREAKQIQVANNQLFGALDAYMARSHQDFADIMSRRR